MNILRKITPILLTTLTFLTPVSAVDLQVTTCPKCKSDLYFVARVDFQPIQYLNNERGWLWNTWKCPKESCGYENFDGIDYCCLCGTQKPRN